MQYIYLLLYQVSKGLENLENNFTEVSFFLQCFQYSLIVRKERLHINKDPFLEFLTVLVVRVHAKLNSIESNSVISLRHNLFM